MSSPTRSEQTKAGLQLARANGRHPGRAVKITDATIRAIMAQHPRTTDEAAKRAGLSRSQYIVRRRRIEAEDARQRAVLPSTAVAPTV